MLDYEYIFAKNLHEKLKQTIKGGIYCSVNENDQLYVKIINDGDLKFELYIYDISEKIVNGYSTDYALYEIMQKYKKFILHRFIKE